MNMTVPRLALLLCVLACGAVASSVYRREQDGSLTTIDSNGTSTAETPATHGNDTAKVTRFSSIREYMPTIKSVFIFVCGFSSLLIICLIVKIFSSSEMLKEASSWHQAVNNMGTPRTVHRH
ncbi:PREDICTED: membrane protein FAM174B [Nanorana parkeri]|uniref:membrane protein FAM174B n=1 Tax=Nanorana parkeri TaxID=125878 RepID=UPI00085427EC|nr:PREDICTED: membrane protein FAM174B [Nanorana parkeri]